MADIDQVYQLLERELNVEMRRLPESVSFAKLMAIFVPGKSFAIFGAGLSGKSLYEFLRAKGCMVSAFIDNNPLLDGSDVYGVEVFSPSRFGEEGMRQQPVLIASMHYYAISKQLAGDFGLNSFSDYYVIHGFLLEDNIMGSGYGSELELYLQDHYEHIISVAELWSDDHSRWRYFRYIYLRLYFLTPDYMDMMLFSSQTRLGSWAQEKLSRCLKLPPPVAHAVEVIMREHIYDFGGENPVSVRVGDRVIDGGAWLGDSTLNFGLQVTPAGKVWAFEPDANKCHLLRQNLSDVGMDDFIEVAPLGLWSSNTTLKFAVSDDYHGAGSYLSDQGEITVDVSSVDAFMESKGEQVDFIKLDIEGSELEALNGAIKTIVTMRPRLAICLYHKKEDLHQIPLYVSSLGCNYRMHFYHRGLVPTDAIMFAAVKG